jgi:hypothetical protein
MNIWEPNLAYFTSILKKLAENDCEKTCPTKLYLTEYNKNVRCASHKYL